MPTAAITASNFLALSAGNSPAKASATKFGLRQMRCARASARSNSKPACGGGARPGGGGGFVVPKERLPGLASSDGALTAQSAAKPAGADPMNRSVANPVKRQFLNAT